VIPKKVSIAYVRLQSVLITGVAIDTTIGNGGLQLVQSGEDGERHDDKLR